MKIPSCLLFLLLLPLAPGEAAPLARATITEVVKDVKIISARSKKQAPAAVKEIFETPDILRTGADSRAEMVADDQTVTRVGSNTFFSFKTDTREIELQRGSLLFQSPTGRGGGTIRTAAASAAVLGTTLVVVATRDGGFKVLLVEGKGKVVGANGATRILSAGELTFALPGGKLGPVMPFKLQDQVAGSRLVSGFKRPLPSAGKIAAAIEQQNAQIGGGRLLQTGLLVGDSPTEGYAVVARDVLVRDRQGTTKVTKSDADRFKTASTSDVVIAKPQLDADRLFVIPSGKSPKPTSGQTQAVAAVLGQAGNVDTFVARDATMATSGIDLAQSGGNNAFQLLALRDVKVDRSVTLAGAGRKSLSVLAGRTLRNAPNTILRTTAPSLVVAALGSSVNLQSPANQTFSDQTPLALDHFGLENAGGDIALIGPSTSLQSTGIAAGRDLYMLAHGDLKIADSVTTNPAFLPATPNGGPNPAPNRRGLEALRRLDLRADRGLVLQRVDLSAENIRVAAQNAIRVTGARFSNRDFDRTRGSFQMTAGPLIDLNGVIFRVQDVSLAARTINLRNVNFSQGSRVRLDVRFPRLAPRPNTNQPSLPGFVNFLRNVNYGGQPAQNFVRADQGGQAGGAGGNFPVRIIIQ